MSDRRSSSHHHHHHHRPTFEEKCRALENELKRKNETIIELRNEFVHSTHQNDFSRSSHTPTEASILQNTSRRSSTTSNWSGLAKDREIAKLKALVFQKDNELINLTSTHKNALLQMEDRMERERKVWNEHKELLLAGERAKFEEEKLRSLKDLQHQLNVERDRCEHLEKKLYEAQMQSNEAQSKLKESNRERINAIHDAKEQCRKEFQDEIHRLRNQFQMEKDSEFSRVQKRVRELEETLDQVSTENADHAVRQHELFLKLETSEKNCVRSVNDSVKKLLTAMDSPAHIFATIPNVSSFNYDRDSLVDRLPTRSVLKILQDTVDDIRHYIVEQRVQIDTKTKFLKKPKLPLERKVEYSSNGTVDSHFSKSKSGKNSEIDRFQRDREFSINTEQIRTPNNTINPFQLSPQQNNTIDNLVEKLENHIASELDRLTKQRVSLNSSNFRDDRSISTSYRYETPKKVKFESVPLKTRQDINQDSLIRHLQNRISNLREDNMRLRDNQQSTSILSSFHDSDSQHSFSPMASRNYSTTQ